jgi:hypothetical protein
MGAFAAGNPLVAVRTKIWPKALLNLSTYACGAVVMSLPTWMDGEFFLQDVPNVKSKIAVAMAAPELIVFILFFLVFVNN